MVVGEHCVTVCLTETFYTVGAPQSPAGVSDRRLCAQGVDDPDQSGALFPLGCGNMVDEESRNVGEGILRPPTGLRSCRRRCTSSSLKNRSECVAASTPWLTRKQSKSTFLCSELFFRRYSVRSQSAPMSADSTPSMTSL